MSSEGEEQQNEVNNLDKLLRFETIANSQDINAFFQRIILSERILPLEYQDYLQADSIESTDEENEPINEIIVCGTSGNGKTSFIKILSQFINQYTNGQLQVRATFMDKLLAQIQPWNGFSVAGGKEFWDQVSDMIRMEILSTPPQKNEICFREIIASGLPELNRNMTTFALLAQEQKPGRVFAFIIGDPLVFNHSLKTTREFSEAPERVVLKFHAELLIAALRWYFQKEKSKRIQYGQEITDLPFPERMYEKYERGEIEKHDMILRKFIAVYYLHLLESYKIPPFRGFVILNNWQE